MSIPGTHHVTAFARSPQVNMDFYTSVLGMRRIKIAVNYDDPSTYHLYYADRIGTPGTVMTFFPHPGAKPGRHGSGQASATSFAVPANTIDFWHSRLTKAGAKPAKSHRFAKPCISFIDPDGLQLELVGIDDPHHRTQPWATEEVPADSAILGFHSITLTVRDAPPTIEFLRDRFGFHMTESAENITRMRAGTDDIGSIVDVLESPNAPRGSFGPGTVHHVAWRIRDEHELDRMRTMLIDHGFSVTEIRNRNYFRSIYFREPGGVIFEIATDGPGFTIDEPEAALGSGLCLPHWLEPHRTDIEAQLPPLA